MGHSAEYICIMQAKCVAQHARNEGNIVSTFSKRNLQWTADGTCLLATNYANSIETFIVPVDLLEVRETPHSISSYYAKPSPEPVNAVLGVPFFDLQTPSTALVLSSSHDQPLRLSSGLTGERVASYPIVNPLTESYICASSLAFSIDGQHVIAGSQSLLSIFDISQPGQEPLQSIQTGPRRVKDDRWNPSTSIRGIISTLVIEPASNILAAGTFSRQIGLYEASGRGECIGAFTIAGSEADKDIGGSGITQISWSACGRYLYIAERKSDGIMVYDVRKSGQLLSWCKGRNANTSQRLGFDVAQADGGVELWGGGLDGIVRIWKEIHAQEGAVSVHDELRTHSGEFVPVTSHVSG